MGDKGNGHKAAAEIVVAEDLGVEEREDLARRIEMYRKEAAFVAENQAALYAQYPKKWIAVYDGEVRAVGDNPDQLIADICSTNHIPTEDVFFKYLAADSDELVGYDFGTPKKKGR